MNLNAAHVHLLLNHIPVLGTIFCAALLLAAVLLKNAQFERVSFFFLVIVALGTLGAYLSGDQASDLIRKLRLPDVALPAIEAHDASAQWVFILLDIIGGGCLLALIVYRRRPSLPRWAVLGALILSLLASAAAARTAYLGGFIRHSEIRSGPPALSLVPGGTARPGSGCI